MFGRLDSYSLFQCFPNIPGTEYGEKFQDNGDSQSSLGLGTFKWLVSIRPFHLVYRCGDDCYLEPFICSAASPDSLVMIKCTLVIQTLG